MLNFYRTTRRCDGLSRRAFLQAAFPQAMTYWSVPFAEDRFAGIPSSILTMPFAQPAYDAVTTATPLALMKFDRIFAADRELMVGLTSGSVGETCGVLILLGGMHFVTGPARSAIRDGHVLVVEIPIPIPEACALSLFILDERVVMAGPTQLSSICYSGQVCR